MAEQTITQTTQPFAGQLPFLTKGFQAAQDDILNRPQQFFPGSTVVPFSNQTEAALQGTEQRAQQGSYLNNLASNQLASTLGGAYTQPNFAGASGAPAQLPQNPPQPQPGYQPSGPAATPGPYGGVSGMGGMNPYLQNVASAAQSAIQPGLDSSFAASGRGASGAHYSELAKQMSNAVAPLAFQNYENERGRQMQAAQMAPGQAGQDYADLAMLGQVGGQREGLAQQQMADQIARFNFGQQEPSSRINDYMRNISGQYGGTQTTTTPLTSNSLLSGLGGAGIGASIGRGIGGESGFGGLSSGAISGIGAGLGGLLGLFA